MEVKYGKLAEAYKKRYEKFEYQFELDSPATLVDDKVDDKEFKYLAEKLGIKNDKPEDFVILKSVLATSLPFVNKNGNAFKQEELVEAVEGGQLGQLQPAIVDYRHNFIPMGNSFTAEVIDSEVDVDTMGMQPVKQVVVYSVFYAWLFPDVAEDIKRWAEKGILTFSMACGADDVEIANGSTRILIKPQFIANSIIPPDGEPADRNASLIALAGKTINDKQITKAEEKIMEKQIKDLQDTVLALQGQIDTQKETIDTYEASEQAKVLDAVKAELLIATEALDALKIEVAEKDTTAQTASDEATTAFDTLKAEKEELDTKYEAALIMVKDVRQAEVDGINEARKAALVKAIEKEEDVEHYMEKFIATLSEDGEVVNDSESFDRFIALFDIEDEGDDSPESAKVKASKAAAVVASKIKDGEDNKNVEDWA